MTISSLMVFACLDVWKTRVVVMLQIKSTRVPK